MHPFERLNGNPCSLTPVARIPRIAAFCSEHIMFQMKFTTWLMGYRQKSLLTKPAGRTCDAAAHPAPSFLPFLKSQRAGWGRIHVA